MLTKLPGLNVQAPWASLLLEGKKLIETRTYPLPEKYQGQDLWLIETPGRFGKFKARVIGIIRFSGCKRYMSASDFYDETELHLINQGDPAFSWTDGRPKFGWIVEKTSQIRPFDAPTPRGIIYSSAFDRGLEN